jgi:DNA end-binding protein Ku
MYFADEIRPIDEIKPKAAKVSKQELEMARQLIESLSGSFDPGKYKDSYRDALCEIIERKRKGEEIHVDTGAEEEERVPDLMEALRASLRATEGRTNGKRRGGGARRRNGLSELSKDELYERAKKADIPGRADMSKEELIEALEAA